ncbi:MULTISPECIES: hypothetical protein [unclassified Aureispira]|uniref:hypothetical protein n=1 Tax=unclassified Aureispira TaxID=2649989 RepID=UPI0006968F44|nr:MULTISPECIES: hypothetical protein [unclassified Aureispira]WMX14778.1 hypothetical protein QP953_00140 [Aureispira sp. CCB-E]
MDNLGKQRLGKLGMELIWWLLTAVVAWIVTKPLWSEFVRQEFIYELILFIIIFITYTRYLFLLKYTFLSHFQIGKFILIFASIPLTFYLIQMFFNYQDFLERQSDGMEEYQIYFRSDITFSEHGKVLAYMTKVYSFFALSAIIAVVISPFRLLLSFWRVYNKVGTV